MAKKTEFKKKDKSGHISGERFKLARNLKKNRLKDIADKFNVYEDTIKKWQQRGIPKKSISAVADHFGVEEWVFYDKNITEQTFKEIIGDPSLIDKYRPVNRATNRSPALIFKYKNKYEEGESAIFRSDPFLIPDKAVLINASFWTSVRYSELIISVVNKEMDEYYKNMRHSAGFRPKDPIARFALWDEVDSEVKISGQEFVKIFDPGYHFLSVFCKDRFEIAVYDLKQFPDTK